MLNKMPEHSSRLEYHQRQYDDKYGSTISLINFMKKFVDPKKQNTFLDIGCGGGANIYWINKDFANSKFTGIDIDKNAITLSKKYNRNSEFKLRF